MKHNGSELGREIDATQRLCEFVYLLSFTFVKKELSVRRNCDVQMIKCTSLIRGKF
jgi:hypothetical protein